MFDFMRVVVLALILMLLGATVIVGLNFEDDADTMTLQGRTQRLRVNLQKKTLSLVGRPSPNLDPSRTSSEIAPRSSASLIDFACILRC
jgi:hypothetical protein